MENKLQELTDKLYNEGLSKGKAEGEVLLAKAKTSTLILELLLTSISVRELAFLTLAPKAGIALILNLSTSSAICNL